MKRNKKTLIRLFLFQWMLIFGFLSSAVVFAYPLVVNQLNNMLDTLILKEWRKEEVQKIQLLNEAKAERAGKEERLRLEALSDPFSKESLENAKIIQLTTEEYTAHTIGFVHIPKVGICLPIFNSSKEVFLTKGASWIANTDYPLGKVGWHTVLTSHTGVPEADLFTNIAKLAIGDVFIIERPNQVYMAYKIFRIKVVAPDDNRVLERIKDKDLFSLVTCYPYMINTHRLVATGERIKFTPSMLEEVERLPETLGTRRKTILWVIISISVIVLLVFLYSLRCFRKRWKKLEE